MRSSHSSNSASEKRKLINPDSLWVRIVTWIVRELTGVVFIFSGFTKAVDPWGTLYKIQDYLGVMGLDIWPSLVKVGAFLLCAVEFIIGIMLCFGSFRRTAAWGATAIMCFMLPLTLWIALYNPVPDCGCFGDALIISNWATFGKNVALMIGVIWLSIFNRHAGWLITPALQWIGLLATSVFCIAIEAAGYFYQPLLDFRPYPIGTSISETSSEEEPEYKFIYEKDGFRKEFSETDELPDEADGWKFIDRISVGDSDIDSRITVRSEKDLRLWDTEAEEDVTEDVLPSEGRQILLVMPDLDKVSIASTWKINSLYDWAIKNDIEMIAAASSTKEGLETWKDLSIPEYPVYTAEDTVLKELVRGNPAVVYIENGEIMWKSTLRAINTDDFMAPETATNPMAFSHNDRAVLINTSALYASVMACLVTFSFLFRVRLQSMNLLKRKRRFFGKRAEKNQSETSDSEITHDDTALPEE
ncbi:MAG: DoxX family protein [Muribaculaceae bacterium]|nr:DoxX family protein [Muribaculaceae bacterium]